MQLSFKVKKSEDGLFLRDFLRLNEVSAGLRSAVKRDRGFFCNGAEVHTNARVHTGDVISFRLPDEPPTDVTPQELHFFVVYEDEHAMVVQKPLGQAVHPTFGHADGTLANAFCGEMQRRGVRAVFRPVNRIDRGTSGMVLCAMNAYAAPILAKTCQKVYYAVVDGKLSASQGVIDAPIAHCTDSLVKHCVSPAGKPSRTEYEVLCETDSCSLVRCVPLTGRTHQIRVHFAWLGHPLVGDDLYGGNDRLTRPALHCGQLTFSVTRTVRVQMPLADDMRTLLCKKRELTQDMWLLGQDTIVKEM